MKDFDDTQAIEEGWCISCCEGSHYIPNGWYDLQRWDEDTEFNTDQDAVAFVHQRAIDGSEYHREALSKMEDMNFRMVRELQKSAG
jgi:hypothetical protein